MKKIAVLSSGGDSQGMNTALKAVILAAKKHGMSVVGVRGGYIGLVNKDLCEMTEAAVSDIGSKGGTFLKTVRFPEFKEPEYVQRAVDTCKEEGIEGLVVIGGDGSFRGALDMTRFGIPTVAMPGTIDNDLGCSEYTIGFDTAVNVAMEAIDKIRDTSASHFRCAVAVVMGRDAGWIALNTGIAVGAVYTLVREVPFTVEEVYEKINKAKALGQDDFVVVCAEGIFAKPKKGKETNPTYDYLLSLGMETAEKFAEAIQAATGVEARATTLGHMQRGGAPTAQDRNVASRMGWHCADLLEQGLSNRVVVVKDGKITDMDIEEALKMKKTFDLDLYKKANAINI